MKPIMLGMGFERDRATWKNTAVSFVCYNESFRPTRFAMSFVLHCNEGIGESIRR